ncbi:hypothetical protein BDW67DRAFT_31558 [Aspergillus spinulosporus]
MALSTTEYILLMRESKLAKRLMRTMQTPDRQSFDTENIGYDTEIHNHIRRGSLIDSRSPAGRLTSANTTLYTPSAHLKAQGLSTMLLIDCASYSMVLDRGRRGPRIKQQGSPWHYEVNDPSPRVPNPVQNMLWYRSDSETHSNTLSFATTKPGLRAGSLFHLGVRVGGTGY